MKLPSWATSYRPSQVKATQQILEAFDDDIKVVFLEAPTGSGKTLIGEMVRQSRQYRGIYLCSSLSLQHQYMDDFPSAKLLMGRSNYPTLDYQSQYRPGKFGSITCADCTKERVYGVYKCRFCSTVSDCPYEQAKAAAAASNQVCSNTYYFLYEANFVGTLSGRGLVVVDECDTLESILMSFIQVEVTRRQVKEYGLPIPSRKTVESAWVDWAYETRDVLAKLVQQLPEKQWATIPELKRARSLTRLHEDVCRLTNRETGLESGGWVYTGYKDDEVVFKPVRVDRFAQKYLWDKGERFLLMSASIISVLEQADTLGLV